MPINRNTEAQFAMNAQVNIPRSQFDCSHELLTTFNVGELIPIELTEVVAGDTWQYKTHSVVRMQPMVTSPFDVLELDTYYFYAPMRILWEHFAEFLGENKSAPWIQNTEYSIPQLVFPKQADPSEYAWRSGTLCDYLGIPQALQGGGFSVNALPFRMYAMIVNEFFRDENLQNPVEIDLGDSNTTAFNYNATDEEMRDYVTALTRGGYPFIAGKLSDYFTRALPGPQRGPDTYVLPSSYVYFGDTRSVSEMNQVISEHPTKPNTMFNGNSNVYGYFTNSTGTPINATFQPNNWMVENPTINQLRIAFQVQKYYEALGRSGSRYREIMRGIYGVQLSDKTVQIPEYLGGNRQTIFANQVLSTVGTDDAPQGSVSGYVLKSDSHGDFIASFEEPGYIMGLAVVRYHHKYQNGINRLWSRKDKFDFYAPQFANIGEQPVLNKEIFLSGSVYDINEGVDNEVFGYQEAWADYRYKPSIVTGEMRSNISRSLDSWHFADDYDVLPTLGDSWIKEDKSNVDRSLAVQSSISNQLFADFWFDCKATRPMPVHSIPGLVDHF